MHKIIVIHSIYLTLAILGMIQRRVDINFTQCIWMMHLGHLGPLEMINSSPFHWLCALLLIVWPYFSGIVFEGGLWHFLPEIPHHLPLTIILGRDLTFGDLIPLIDAPPMPLNLVNGMLSWHIPLRSDYAIILTFWAIPPLPSRHYFVIGIYYQLLLCGGIVFAPV